MERTDPTSGPGEAARGFTLVELLVALSIVVVLVTGIYTSFSVGLKVRGDYRGRVGALQTARRLVAILREDLANLSSLHPTLAVEDEGLSLLRYAPAGGGASAASAPRPGTLLNVRYRWGSRSRGRSALVREVVLVAWADVADPAELMGYTVRGDTLVPAWIEPPDSSPAAGSREPASAFPGITAFSATPLHRELGSLAPAPGGIQDSTAAALAFEFVASPAGGEARDGLAAAAPSSAAYRLTVRFRGSRAGP